MLQKILLLLTTSLLLSIGARAQDVQVDVTHFLYDQNGSISEFGEIKFTFNPDILPVDFTLDPNCTSSGNTISINVTQHTFSPNICFGEDASEYCFTIIKDITAPEPCTLKFCVTVLVCRLKEWKEGQYIRTCPKEPDVKSTIKRIVQNNQEQIPVKAEEKNINLAEKIVEEVEGFVQSPIQKKFTLQKAYPNPFKNEINVELESAHAEKATVRLLDLMGKDVHQEVIEIEQGNNKFALTPQQDLPSGTYLLHIYRHDGQLITTKLIKTE